MWGSDACAAAGAGWRIEQGAFGEVEGPAHQRCASTCRAIPGRAGWVAGRGRAAAGSPTRADRGPPHRHRRWRLLAGQLDPSPRWVAVWRQPSCSPRRRPPAVDIMAAPVPGQCRPSSSLARPSRSSSTASGPVPCSLQVLQVAMAAERPWTRHARQRQSRVCGCTVAKLRPTQQAGANAKPEAHGALAARPGAAACRTRSESGPHHLHRGGLRWIVSVGGCGRQASRWHSPADALPTRQTAWHTQSAAVVLGEKVPVDLARRR
jgi:hypothetical protein